MKHLITFLAAALALGTTVHAHPTHEEWTDLSARVVALEEAVGINEPTAACDPAAVEVLWNPAGETLQQAYQRLPGGSSLTIGGTIGIPAGTHVMEGLWMKTGGDVRLCGVSAERPVLLMERSISLNNGTNANYGVGGSLTIEHLELGQGRGEVVLAGGKVSALTMKNVYQHDCANNGIHTSLQPDHQLMVTLEDYRVERCGQGNTKHNVYVSTRNAVVIARRVTSCGANESHAFKSIARTLIIEDSAFDTFCPGDEAGPWSTTLIDVAACADTVIRRTTITGKTAPRAQGSGNRGSVRMVQYKARRGIFSCDLPPFSAVSDPMTDFTDPAFWAAPTPAVFRHEIVDSTFIRLGGVGTAIRNDGTYPRTFVRPFWPQSVFFEVIPEWFERAESHVNNVTFTNIPAADRYDMTSHEPVDESSDPGATIPPPPRPLYVDGVPQ